MPLHTKTKILFHDDARKAILKGVNLVNDAVKMSIGPAGGNALFYGLYGRTHRISNDGITIAEVIESKDEFEQLAINAYKDAMDKTNILAGDATSATGVITGKLMNDVFGLLSKSSSLEQNSENKFSVMKICKDILADSKIVEEAVKKASKEIKSLEDLKKIAIVSMENEEVGNTIAEMAWKVGKDGFIDTIEGFKGKIDTEIIEGARFPAKIAAKGFINNAKRFEMVAKDVAVILTNYDLNNISEVAGFLKPILKRHPKIALLSPEYSQDVLNDFWKASYGLLPGGVKEKKALEIYPIKTPSLKTTQWEDLEVYFGAKFIDKNKGMKLADINETDLGFAEKIVVKDADTREDATALGGAGTKEDDVEIKPDEKMKVKSMVTERISMLKQQVEETKDNGRKLSLKRRIAGLGSAVGVIRVGSPSDAETYYLKKKVEDAVYACKAALEEGYVEGGGICLKKIAEKLPKESLLAPALKAPYDQIQDNAEEKLEIGKEVIDPAKAIRLAVKHACSVSAHLATVKVMIPEEREMSPAEGYMEIAKILAVGIRYWAKERGIIKENQEEIDRDTKAQHDEILRNSLD